MGEEEPRAHLLAQAAQVLVGPGGPHLTVDARLRALAVPPDAEAVPVRPGLGLDGVEGLVDQRMSRGADELVEEDRRALVGEKAAHRLWRPLGQHITVTMFYYL